MAYNKNLFAQAGLNPNRPPASWDEVLDMARRLTRTDGNKLIRRGYFITTEATEFELFAANSACPILSEDYRAPVFNQACGLDTLNFMKRMYEINNPAGYSSSLSTSANTGFYNGQAVMIRAAGGGVATQVATKYSDMVDMGVFLPRRSAAYQPATTSSINSLAILRFTKHPNEAWRVMEHLNRRESLEQVALLRGQQIPRYDVIPFAARQMPETVPFYEVLENLVPRPKWPSGAGYTYNSALGDLVKAAMVGQESPEAALAEAERRVQLLLNDFWRTAI